MSEQLPEIPQLEQASERSEYPVTRGQAREFMKRIADERFIWEKLHASGQWGGHLHRAILGIALGEGGDEEVVDIIPLYVDEYVKQPPHYQAGEDIEYLAQTALHSVTHNADIARHKVSDLESYDPNYLMRRDEALRQLESSFGYFGQSEISPGLLRAFDDATNERIQDKYFYGRNGMTGERYSDPKFPEYTENPIPKPEN
jgi:hypothetical protein